MPKQSKNLSLDPEVIRRAERYSELHRTNVSKLVSDFLSSLPLGEEGEDRELSPAVRRLLGDADFQQALVLGLDDFEDAVQAAAALRIGADYLVLPGHPRREGLPGDPAPCPLRGGDPGAAVGLRRSALDRGVA